MMMSFLKHRLFLWFQLLLFIRVDCLLRGFGSGDESEWIRSNENQIRRIRERNVAESPPVSREEEEELFRVIANYDSDREKNRIATIAWQVLKEIGRDSLVIAVDEGGFEALHKEGIKAERDHFVTGLESPKASRVQEKHDASHYRSLLEHVPYGISLIQADQLSVGTSDVTVCIVDTGIAIDHPDLNATMITGDDNGNMKWDEDLNGHGTHTAGVVAAVGGNGMGVRGVGRIKLHITRGLGDDLGGYESDIILGVNQCIDAGAKIIMLSLGGTEISANQNDLYKDIADNKDVLVVAAAGNQGRNLALYPAAHPDVMAVGSVGPTLRHSSFSNYGDQLEIVGPGEKIMSTGIAEVALTLPDFSYPMLNIGSKVKSVATGNLVDCGDGSYPCTLDENEICFMTRQDTDLTTMTENCQDGGGGALVLVWAPGRQGKWDTNIKSKIPVVVAPYEAASRLIFLARFSQDQTQVTITFADKDEPEHSYNRMSGTSMATPHVAAAAALVWSHFPQCTSHQIRFVLALTALEADGDGCDWYYGYGVVQARNAYDYLLHHDCSKGGEAEWGKRSEGGCTTVPHDFALSSQVSPSSAPSFAPSLVSSDTDSIYEQTIAPESGGPTVPETSSSPSHAPSALPSESSNPTTQPLQRESTSLAYSEIVCRLLGVGCGN